MIIEGSEGLLSTPSECVIQLHHMPVRMSFFVLSEEQDNTGEGVRVAQEGWATRVAPLLTANPVRIPSDR